MKHFLALCVFWLTVAATGQVASVGTISNLVRRVPSTLNTDVLVQGYHTAGDGGGGLWRWNSTSTAATNFAVFRGTNIAGGYLPTGRWIIQTDDGIYNVRQFGALPWFSGPQVGYSTNIQSAIDHAFLNGGGSAYIPPGIFVIDTTILLRWRTGLDGVQAAYSQLIPGNHTNTYEAIRSMGLSCLSLATNANVRMIYGDYQWGPLHNPSSPTTTLQNGETVTARWAQMWVRNLALYGNGYGQTENNCDGMFFENIFGLEIRNVSFLRCAGYMARFNNINCWTLTDINALGGGAAARSKGFYLSSVADGFISSVKAFTPNGPLFWFDYSTAWQNPIWGCLIGNSLNQAPPALVTNVLNDTDIMTDIPLQVEVGDPVYPQVEGLTRFPFDLETPFPTFPTNIARNQTYFITSILAEGASNVYRISKNLANRTNAIGDPMGTITNTWWVSIGPNNGIFLNQSANLTFVGVRAEQHHESSVRIDGGQNNSFLGTIHLDAGENNTNAFTPSILLGNLARQNMFENIILGRSKTNNNNYVGPMQIDSAGGNFFGAASYWTNTTTRVMTNLFYSASFGSDSYFTIYGAPDPAGTKLKLSGGAGGARILWLERPGTGTNGLSVSGGGAAPRMLFYDEGNARIYGSMLSSATQPVFGIGSFQDNDHVFLAGILESPTRLTGGTNMSATDLILRAGQGTGTDVTRGNIQFQVPNINSTPTNLQSYTVVARFARDVGTLILGTASVPRSTNASLDLSRQDQFMLLNHLNRAQLATNITAPVAGALVWNTDNEMPMVYGLYDNEFNALGPGGPTRLNEVTNASSYNITLPSYAHWFNTATQSVTVNLPNLFTNRGKIYVVGKTSTEETNSITIDADGSDLINGAANIVITNAFRTVTIYGAESGWVASYGGPGNAGQLYGVLPIGNGGTGQAVTNTFPAPLYNNGSAGFTGRSGFLDESLIEDPPLETFAWGSSASQGSYGWSRVTSGAGAAEAFALMEQGCFGIYTMGTGTTAAGYKQLHNNVTSIRFDGSVWWLTARVRFPALSDANETFRFRGLFGDNLTGTNHADGIWAEYCSTDNSGNWMFKTSINSVTTTNFTTIPASTNWTMLRAVVDVSVPRAVLYIDGVPAATNTTDIPTGGTRTTGMNFGITAEGGAVGTVTDLVYLDLVKPRMFPTTPR